MRSSSSRRGLQPGKPESPSGRRKGLIPLAKHDRDSSLTLPGPIRTMRGFRGAIAQLGERLHGMQEVGGSIPPSSTKIPLTASHVPIV